MSTPANFLVQVQTYQRAQLARLLNYGCFIHNSNKKFKDFDKLTANLGDTVTFDLPPRFVSSPSLVANFQSSVQRFLPLTVDQAWNTSYEFTPQQFIFNVREYMAEFGMSAVDELAVQVESYVAGLAERVPYRFYGDGVTQINSFTQLAQMLAQYRTYGFAHSDLDIYLSDIAEPIIAGSGQNQFVIRRNEELANTWVVGDWSGAHFYQSNLLPIHQAGTVGDDALTLTVTGTNDPTGNNVTQIYCSGAAASDPNAIKQYDSAQFVNASPTFKFLTFVGHKLSAAPVQMLITADAASDGGGNVTLNIQAGSIAGNGLCSVVGNQNQNIPSPVQVGMEIQILPSHRCGMIVGGKAMYLGMPQLPEMVPFPTANKTDPETGATLRSYYGSIFGQPAMGFIHDTIYGAQAAGEYCMKIAFPL